jgi:hypothetical protein
MDKPKPDFNEAARSTAEPLRKPEPRKPYAAPRLLVHGTVEKITQNPDGAATDGLGGSHGP